MMVAEHDGPTMFARIGVMRALHRHKPKATPSPHRKRPKAYRIIRYALTAADEATLSDGAAHAAAAIR